MIRVFSLSLLLLLCLSSLGNAQTGSWQERVSRRQYAEVIASAQDLSPADSANYEQMYALAQAYEGMLKYREALGYYRYCLAADTTNIDLLNATARMASSVGRTAEAERYYLKVLQADSTNFYANHQLARFYFQTENYAKALDKYNGLISQDSNNVAILRSMGDCFTRLENPLSAAFRYFRAYSLNRENVSLASDLVNTLLRIGGEYAQDALAICDTALSYNPGNQQLRRNKGMALYTNRKYAEADTIYSGLMADGDSTYLTLKYTGASCYHAGQYLRAIEPLELAYTIDTTSVEVCLLLGSALGRSYDRQRAYYLFDLAEKLMNPKPELVNLLTLFRAETLQRDSRRKEATALYYKYWLSNPKLDILSTMSNLYSARNQGDYSDDDQRQRGLFLSVLYVREYLKSKGDLKQLTFKRGLLESFYENAFFRQITDLPMLAPDGKKSTISVVDLRELIRSFE
jgi:cytochrome c-type biogenesis protein CcmH/NrfG